MPPIYAAPLFSAVWPKGTPVYEDASGSSAGGTTATRRYTVRAGNALDAPTRYLVSGTDKGEMDWLPAKGYTDPLPLGASPMTADVTVLVSGATLRGKVSA